MMELKQKSRGEKLVVEIENGTTKKERRKPLSLCRNKDAPSAVSEEVRWSLEETVTLKTAAFIHELLQAVKDKIQTSCVDKQPTTSPIRKSALGS